MDYPKTLTALNRLENALTCTQCQNLSSTLCTLGACEHLFCRKCCNSLLGTCCPQCKIPVHVKDAQVNRQLSNLVSLCQELGRILVSGSHGDGQTSGPLERDQDLSIQDIQESTPETGQQYKSHAQFSKHQHQSGAGIINREKGHSHVKDSPKQPWSESRKINSHQNGNVRQRKQTSRSTRLRHGSGDAEVMSDGELMGDGEVMGDETELNSDAPSARGRKRQKMDVLNGMRDEIVKARGTSRSGSRSCRGKNRTNEKTEKMNSDTEDNNNGDQTGRSKHTKGSQGPGRSRSRTRIRGIISGNCAVSGGQEKAVIQDGKTMTQFDFESAESEADVSDVSESDGSEYTVTRTAGGQSRRSQGTLETKTRPKRRSRVPEKPADQSTMTQFYDESGDDSGGEDGVSDDGVGKKMKRRTRKRQGTSDSTVNGESRRRSRSKVTEKPANQSTMTQFYEYNDEELPLLEMPDEADVKNKAEVPKGRDSRSASKGGKPMRRGRSKDQAPQGEIAGTPCSTLSDISTVGSGQKTKGGKKQGMAKVKTSPVFSKSPQKRARRSLGGSQGEGQVKRNARGETPLHVAAIKGDLNRVKILLESGAKPNVRDNAGWTPLHECCNHGYTEIVEQLLNHGAMINIPGMENDTPLHDAVTNHRLDVVKLLVSRGASVSARNIHGQTPFDFAKTEEMRRALDTPISEPMDIADESVLAVEEEFQPLCFLGTALSRDDGVKLQKCASVLHAKVMDTFTPEVSHLITSCNKEGQCPRTLKYLHAVLAGKWVVSVEWLDLCLEYKQKVCEEAFEVPGSSTNPDSQAATKGRLNRRQQLPGLFDGCQFYFHGTFHSPTPEKEELQNLVKCGGGKILSREPKLQNIDDYSQTVPYHAEKTSVLKDCGVFIIYDKTTTYPVVKASRICAVPANWIMDCIASFTLRDPSSV